MDPPRLKRTNSKSKIVKKAGLVDAGDVFVASMAPAATPQWVTRQNIDGSHSNEDRPILCQGALWTESGEELTFCIAGVADGHGGASASELIALSAPELLTSDMCTEMGDVSSAVLKTFNLLEDRCLRLPDMAGACVCICVVGAGKVWCANCGDCRAVLYGWEGDATLLSIDQRAAEGAEYQRVIRAGGAVVGGAVEGLMPSRSLGDADIKSSCPAGVVLAVPEIRVFEGDGLVILGSDGLWDVLSVEDVAALLPPPGKARRRSAQDTDVLKAIAEHLVKVAVDRGSADDVTVMVVPVL